MQPAFLADAPIPLAMVGILTALPGTALWRRLAAEGRLREHSDGDAFARSNFATTLDEATLLVSYAALLADLYSPAGYLRRCQAYLDRAPLPVNTRTRSGGIGILIRAVWHLGVRSVDRALFWSLLARAARRSPRHIPWAVEKAVQGEHFLRYTRDARTASAIAATSSSSTW